MSTLKIVGISGNPSAPSRTRVLTEYTLETLAHETGARTELIDLASLGTLFGGYVQRRTLPSGAETLLNQIESADALVVGTPVYRGAYSGLFKHLFDLLDQDALVGKPVVLLATGGSERHALIIEHQLRPLFSFFRAHTLPTGVYATEVDFDGYRLNSPALLARVDAVVAEFGALLAGLDRRPGAAVAYA